MAGSARFHSHIARPGEAARAGAGPPTTITATTATAVSTTTLPHVVTVRHDAIRCPRFARDPPPTLTTQVSRGGPTSTSDTNGVHDGTRPPGAMPPRGGDRQARRALRSTRAGPPG
ncbi:hypothetical protein KRM28CT15_35230 [Krasilnikovia sp. M28-CT-15]